MVQSVAGSFSAKSPVRQYFSLWCDFNGDVWIELGARTPQRKIELTPAIGTYPDSNGSADDTGTLSPTRRAFGSTNQALGVSVIETTTSSLFFSCCVVHGFKATTSTPRPKNSASTLLNVVCRTLYKT